MQKSMTLHWSTDKNGNPLALLQVRGPRPFVRTLGAILGDAQGGNPVSVRWGDQAEPEHMTDHDTFRHARAALEAQARRIFATQ